MAEPSTGPAPTPTSTGEAPSPTLAALDAGDFATFEQATLARVRGTPLPERPASAPAAAGGRPAARDAEAAATEPGAAASAPEPPAPRLSRREQEIRAAVDRATVGAREETARLKAELSHLRAQVAQAQQTGREVRLPRDREPAGPPSRPATPVPAPVPAFRRYLAQPDAPKLEQYQDVNEGVAAMAAYVAEQAQRERALEAQRAQRAEAVERVDASQQEEFLTSLHTAIQADPQFIASLSPEVLNLKPITGLEPGERSGPLNVLWEYVYQSGELLAPVLRYFTAHPEELRRIERGPDWLRTLPPDLRAARHIPWINHEFGRLLGRLSGHGGGNGHAAAPPAEPRERSPVSAAPPPPPTLSGHGTTTDLQQQALAGKGDFRLANRLWQEREIARRGWGGR